MTTATEVLSRLRVILDCEVGDIKLVEKHDTLTVIVEIEETAVGNSLFNEEQISQIVKGLTPLTIAHEIKVI